MSPTRSRHFERLESSTRFRRMRPGGLETSFCAKAECRRPFNRFMTRWPLIPKLTVSAISVCWRSTRDIDQILKAVLPDGPDENWGAIQFFVQAREPLPAMAVWKRIAAHHDSFPAADAFPLLDMLIATGHVDEARVVWNQALQAAGVPRESDAGGSLVWNGGFENEPLDGGFDWRFFPIEGAEMRWDEEDLHSGRRSLRVDFDGKTNVDFENVWQYVPVSPSTSYRFSAFFRTEDLTTDSGIHFDIRDVSRPGTRRAFYGQSGGLTELGGTENRDGYRSRYEFVANRAEAYAQR